MATVLINKMSLITKPLTYIFALLSVMRHFTAYVDCRYQYLQQHYYLSFATIRALNKVAGHFLCFYDVVEILLGS
jgi:hypothetical protein